MRQNLNATELPLHKVFDDEYIFKIPSLQRPYSWTTDEAGELLEDLLSFIQENNITVKNVHEQIEPYFLGSIVLVRRSNPVHEVLDGQQRLTTITILLAVLRDYLGGDIGRNIDRRIRQEGDPVVGTKDSYRLKLRDRDNDFFQKYIQSEGATKKINEKMEYKTDSQKKMIENALFFYERLNNTEPEEVEVLPSVLASLCYVVLVSTNSFDSAFRIFTVLNDRGMDLMYSDIFKASVIKDIPTSEEQDRYSLKWEEIEASLGRERFNKLFDHIRMIVQKRKGSQNSRDEYELIFKEYSGEKFMEELLLPYSDIYEKILNPTLYFKDEPEIMKYLVLMHKIDNNDWIPPLMYFMHQNKNTTDIKTFIKKLETLAATSMLLRKNFNWRMTKYSHVLREIERHGNVLQTHSNINVSREDQNEVLNILNGDIYLDVKNSAKRYLLLRLDSILTQGQPIYNYNVLTVEHVLPQNPREDSAWLKEFPDYQDYVHKLGNLVLLTRRKNSQASNYDFHEKKKSYFEPSKGVNTFAITNQVLQEQAWTKEVFYRRQRELVDLLAREWNLRRRDQDLNDEYFLGSPQGADAVGMYIEENDRFVIKKNSKISTSTLKSFSKNHRDVRKLLMNKGIVEERGSSLIFTEDYTFNSPSLAASIVLGRNANGNAAWKHSSGKTLGEIKNS